MMAVLCKSKNACFGRKKSTQSVRCWLLILGAVLQVICAFDYVFESISFLSALPAPAQKARLINPWGVLFFIVQVKVKLQSQHWKSGGLGVERHKNPGPFPLRSRSLTAGGEGQSTVLPLVFWRVLGRCSKVMMPFNHMKSDSGSL